METPGFTVNVTEDHGGVTVVHVCVDLVIQYSGSLILQQRSTPIWVWASVLGEQPLPFPSRMIHELGLYRWPAGDRKLVQELPDWHRQSCVFLLSSLLQIQEAWSIEVFVIVQGGLDLLCTSPSADEDHRVLDRPSLSSSGKVPEGSTCPPGLPGSPTPVDRTQNWRYSRCLGGSVAYLWGWSWTGNCPTQYTSKCQAIVGLAAHHGEGRGL